MEWFSNIIVPVLIAIVPAVLTLIGTLAGVKAQLRASERKAEEDRQRLEDERERKEEQRQEKQEEALKSILRTELLRIYFHRVEKGQKFLTQWESENVHRMYASYTALGGNSFVTDLVNRMNEWDVVQN